MFLPLFVFLSYPIHWSAYKSLNDDLQKRLNSIKETTTTDSTRQLEQERQELTQQQPRTLGIATVQLASHAELPCHFPIEQHFYGTNTSAERVLFYLLVCYNFQ
jgi:hypothetical protein